MAASDTTYRNVKALHVVFAVSSIVMLVTVIGMFADDFYREWKVEQRTFRDVETEMAKRALLAATPAQEKIGEIVQTEAEVGQRKTEVTQIKADVERELGADFLPRKLKAENKKAGIKAEYDSVTSFYNLAVESDPRGANSPDALKHKARMDQLLSELNQISTEVEDNQARYDQKAREKGLPAAEEQLKSAEKKQKDMLADFDRFVKLAKQKRWGAKDEFLALPIIESFSSPTKIQQYTLAELPIDYSFKYVTRYDRCTTCHQGLEKAGFDKEALAALSEAPDKNLVTRFEVAKRIIDERRNKLGEKDLPDPETLRPRRLPLTSGQVTEFCSHPRQELFVDANSPHPGEKFGCTICHGGQGSATDFFNASHSPNDTAGIERWQKDHDWKSNHFWDFPMLPNRFIESSCVKCHYEITDLVRDGVKVEAPKLVKGYNLVRELGCFGCHEISGIKGGRKIGPDLRLENDPPLESLEPAERVKKLSDPLNPPGQFRKVGPSLFRLAEKTNENWVREWVKLPRDFRPHTRMPHFYMQPNNTPEALTGSGQEKFPDAEVQAIAHYLMIKSKDFLADVKAYQSLKAKANRTDAEKTQFAALDARFDVRTAAPLVETVSLPTEKASADRGRVLFSEHGCLACHQQNGTETAGKTPDGKTVPAIIGEAEFGPDLSRVALKLGTKPGDPESGRKWLVSWLLNPSNHSPRTKMPNTHLTPEQANDVASWLLSQKVDWKPVEIESQPIDTYKALARVYLEKAATKTEVKNWLDNGLTVGRVRQLTADADERELVGNVAGKKDDEIIPLSEDRLKLYVGKKAINNMGCYACHAIPGFQAAKPIGTALNEWGKKDPDRLAYEDADAFVKNHFNVVKLRDDPKDKSKSADDWKVKKSGDKELKPYEQYFADMLDHHHRTREGFLALKLEEPRSYDYNRIKTWDDRLRMPQFRFARTKRLPGETDEVFKSRELKEEAEGREAVMTFILGLIAEPVPTRYVNNSTGDRLAEVKGRQVLDKYNCAGCHIISAGSIDFKPVDLKRFETHPEVRKQEVPYKGDDYVYPEHVSWTGLPSSKSDRISVRGVTPPVKDEDEDPTKQMSVWLMQAFTYSLGGNRRDIPAGATITLPRDWLLSKPYEQFGGRFTEVLTQYLQKKDPQQYAADKVSYAFAAAPPTLVSVGEKVQPDFLYQFLLNPYPIRPLTVLRMPKFNMSSDEAQALVDYFTGNNRMRNPGIGLVYPYVAIPQREDSYLREKTAEYIQRLKAEGKYEEEKKSLQEYWDRVLGEQLAAAQARGKQADEAVKAAKNDAEKGVAQQNKDAADAQVKRLSDKEGAKKDLVKQWEEKEAYIADARRLVVNQGLCLTCHNAGGELGKENKGPPLDNVGERMRPDWTQRWITNPTRFLHYNSVMPINFKTTAKENQEAFVGTSYEQIQAARDFLMLYPQIRDWPILKARPILGTAPMGDKK